MGSGSELKFRHKVLLALAAAVLLALGVFLGITLWRLQLSAEARVRQGLENAREAFYRSRQQQADAVDEAVFTLNYTNAELRAVLASGAGDSDPFSGGGSASDELQTLESSLPFLPLYQRSAQFVVVDRSGHVLLAKDRQSLPEGISPAAQEALKGTRSYDWWKTESGTLQIFASPVVVQQQVVGAVLVGTPIDRSFLDPLAEISKTDIEIAPPSTTTTNGLLELPRGGTRHLGALVPVASPSGRAVGAFLVSRSLDEELRDARELRNELLLLGAVVLAFAVGLGLYLASLVSRPLEALGRAVREVKGGNFAFRLSSTSGDEFGSLSRLIDEMSAGLEERERIRATFSRYVDDDVVNEILRNEGAAALDGREQNITVLFADLAHFTAFSEGKSPSQLLRDLNFYFGAMAQAVETEKGVLDKFIGDAIMAYWGAPLQDPMHAERACRAALAMADRFRKEVVPRHPELGLRIGIASGPALVGNVGNEKRQNYTVMGDTVNLASRLEGVNKAFGTTICVSESVQRTLGGKLAFRALGRVRVAGRSEPEMVYELVPELTEAMRSYEACLPLLGSSDSESLRAKLAAYPHDGPSQALARQCAASGWDGVWTLGK